MMEDSNLGAATILVILAVVAVLAVIRLGGTFARLVRRIRRLERKVERRRRPRVTHAITQVKQYPTTLQQVLVPAPTPTPTPPTLVARTAFVDSVYGNNTTAVLERPDLPYLTIQSAIDAAALPSSDDGVQWQVQVRPGSFTENITLAPGVDVLGVAPVTTSADVSVSEVEILGTITWSSTGVEDASISLQNLAVFATDATVLTVATDTVENRRLTCTQCRFVSSWTDPPGFRPIAVSLSETTAAATGDGTTISFIECILLMNMTQTTTTPFNWMSSVVETNLTKLELSRNTIGSVISFPAGSGGSSVPDMVRVTASSTGNTVEVVSRENQYLTVLSTAAPYTGGLDAILPCFTVDAFLGSATVENVLVSLSDAWRVIGPAAVTIPTSEPLVFMYGETSPIQVHMEDAFVRVSGLPDSSALVVVNPILENGLGGLWIRSVTYAGIQTLTAAITVSDPTQFDVRIVDVGNDLNQIGQSYLGTVRTVDGATPYDVDVLDGIVIQQTDNSQVRLPNSTVFPGRVIGVVNDSNNDVNVTNHLDVGIITIPAGGGAIVFSNNLAWYVLSDYVPAP